MTTFALPLAGRRAVVTGGGRGIGAEIGRRLAGEGARVLLAARTLGEVEAVAGALVRDGAEAWAARCDVADPASVHGLSEDVHTHLGGVDILVNNAGVASSAPLGRLTLAEWERLFAVNATGTFLVTQALLPGMVERRWGRVVNVASIAGLTGAPYITAYTASKHAVIGFTRALAAEVAGRGVTVNAVCPGYVDTPMTDESVARIVERTGMAAAEARERLASSSPQGRLLEVGEVAHLVLALCADEARGVTGQALVVDGGTLAS